MLRLFVVVVIDSESALLSSLHFYMLLDGAGELVNPTKSY